jgi:uncharacterized membrane protein YbhN (UPF0104 family)
VAIVKTCRRLVGSLAFVAVLSWRLDWGQVYTAFARLNVSLWLLAVALYLACQFVSSIRWQLLVQAIGFGGWWGQYLAYSFIGTFFNLALPTSVGGDVVRVWYLARQEGAAPPLGRRTGAFVSVLMDRASGLLVLLAVACVAALCSPVPLPAWIGGIAIAGGFAAMLAVLVLPFLTRLQPLFSPSPRLSRLLDGAILYVQRPRELLLTTILALAIQLLNVALVWVIGQALGLQVPAMYYGILVPLIGLLTLLPVSLNGMGLREAGTVVLLAPLGVGPASAMTLAFLTFAASVAASLPGALFYLLGRFPRAEAPSAPGPFGYSS